MIDKQRLRTFLLGGAIGAFAGVLLTPRSGRELRSNLAERAEEVRERSRETYFEKQEHLQERLAETREGYSGRTGEEPKVSLGTDSPVAEKPEDFTGRPDGRPNLREVSSEGYEESSQTGPDELRRKVQETRARLRERLDAPLRPGNTGRGSVEEKPDE